MIRFLTHNDGKETIDENDTSEDHHYQTLQDNVYSQPKSVNHPEWKPPYMEEENTLSANLRNINKLKQKHKELIMVSNHK